MAWTGMDRNIEILVVIVIVYLMIGGYRALSHDARIGFMYGWRQRLVDMVMITILWPMVG